MKSAENVVLIASYVGFSEYLRYRSEIVSQIGLDYILIIEDNLYASVKKYFENTDGSIEKYMRRSELKTEKVKKCVITFNAHAIEMMLKIHFLAKLDCEFFYLAADTVRSELLFFDLFKRKYSKIYLMGLIFRYIKYRLMGFKLLALVNGDDSIPAMGLRNDFISKADIISCDESTDNLVEVNSSREEYIVVIDPGSGIPGATGLAKMIEELIYELIGNNENMQIFYKAHPTRPLNIYLPKKVVQMPVEVPLEMFDLSNAKVYILLGQASQKNKLKALKIYSYLERVSWKASDYKENYVAPFLKNIDNKVVYLK